jgi:hypothetical protein
MINSGRIQYSHLQQAIYQMQPVSELLGHDSQWLKGYRIADYVGRPELGDADPKWSHPGPVTSEELFEDQGGYLYRFHAGEELDIVVFATFLVIEVRPGTQQTEFLVIAPIPLEQQEEELPYAAFLQGQNTVSIQDQLREESNQQSISSEIDELINRLRQPASDARTGFFSKLFNRH